MSMNTEWMVCQGNGVSIIKKGSHNVILFSIYSDGLLFIPNFAVNKYWSENCQN